MKTFRDFEVGPDPFGRTWQVQFKWLQTAISLRHSDSVDVKFILKSDDTRMEKGRYQTDQTAFEVPDIQVGPVSLEPHIE